MEEKNSEKVVKVWDNYDDYKKDWEAEFNERHSKLSTKIKNFFVYKIGWNIRYWWYDTKYYFKNFISFQKVLKEWRPWDYKYLVDLFAFGLELMIRHMERYGHEVDDRRSKKIAAMRELIAELNRDYEDEVRKKHESDYSYGKTIKKITKFEDGSEMHEFKEDEETENNKKEYYNDLSKERKAHYKKIFRLIMGQDQEKLFKDVDKKYEELVATFPNGKKDDPHMSEYEKVYTSLFDGSGIEGWWD